MSEKTLTNRNAAEAKAAIPDLQITGDGDMWGLLGKAASQSQGWMKSTKAMEVPGGVVIQVTTQQRNPDGSYVIAEALTFVPGVTLQRLHKDLREPNDPACWIRPV